MQAPPNPVATIENPGSRGRSLRALATLAPVLALALAAVPARADLLRYEEGIARDPSSASELYREQHWIRSDGPRPVERVVLYRCPDGTAFGRKRIDYRDSATAPAFAFDDRRSGYREGLRQGAKPTLFFRANAGASERSALLDGQTLVADAGFDEFIRQQWTPLIAGKALPLAFAVPSRLRSMEFSVSRAGTAMIAGEKAWVFRLKLGGLLGLVAPSIDVSYGQLSRRLLRFEGLSNLRDNAGANPLLARIDFPSQARSASETQWQAALAAPLSACQAGR